MSNNIEADTQTGAEEDDSDYYSGSDSSTYATSLATVVRAHVYENGRRYNSYKSQHWAPNDDQHQNALDMLHHTFGLVRGGKLHSCPLPEKPQRILDLGTGTGINAIDLADTYPSAKVTGTDLSPIQPNWVPPNLQFEVDDFNDTWTFEDDSFDFINARCLFGAVGDWVKLYKQAFKALKPGGYIESTEHGVLPLCDDGSFPKESAILEAANLFIEGGKSMGKPLQVVDELEGWMREAGFEDIKVETYLLPTNSWPKDKKLKEVGRFMLASMLEGMAGFVMHVYTNVLGLPKDEVQKKVDAVLGEMKNRSYHAYYPLRVVYGRKPSA